MSQTPIRLHLIILPFLFIGTLQLVGCTQRALPPADPGGTYRSTSGGAAFDQSVNLIDHTGQHIGYINDLPLQNLHRPPHLPDTIYATAGGRGIVVSADNGATWRTVNQPLSVVTAVVRLTNDIMLASGTNSDREGVVMRSLDQGTSWERVLTVPAPSKRKSQLFEIIKPPEPPPIYVSSIVLDPHQVDRVYATTSTGDVFAGEESGKTWHTILRIQARRVDPLTQFANAPVRAVVPSPHNSDEVLLVTTDGRVIRVTGGQQEVLATPSVSIVDVAYINQFPNALLIGTVNGAILSRDRGRTWLELDLPISKTTPVNNTVARLSPTNPSRFLIGVDNVIYRSEDGGDTWHTLSLNLPTHIITDISINPTNAGHVLIATTPLQV